MDLEKLKYPIGRFVKPTEITIQDLEAWTDTLRKFPAKLQKVLEEIPENRLDKPYRPGGWTIRQLVNHLADSHVNSYVRFKWTLTEDVPVIKTYDQEAWAELPDGRSGSVGASIQILQGIHKRWVHMLDLFNREDFNKKLKHPEFDDPLSLGELLSLYAWHCKHHLAHIQRTLQ